MSMKETYKQMRELLGHITFDLDKSENGNKAASQRVRTGTVKLEKLAKLFRKESIAFEKKNKDQKKHGKASAGAAKKAVDHKGKAVAPKGKAAPVVSKPKVASVKAKPKPKMAQLKAGPKPREFAAKRATAKLPTRSFRSI